MNRHALSLLTALVVCLPLGASARAQSGSSAPASIAAEGAVAEWMTGERIPALRDLPFSARVELETASQLQDGTQVVHRTYNLDARDSAGRTRNEMRGWIGPDGGEPRLLRIELYDPATHTRTDLFPLTKVARQWVLGPASQNVSATVTAKPETTREDIGSDTMEGLPVKGTRVTQTYPEGALGNDRPLVIVTEFWYSPELRLNLLTKKTDPRHGVQTVRVTSLVRGEPDSSLFAIDDVYRIGNEGPTPVAQGSGGTDEKLPASNVAQTNPALAGIAHPGAKGVGVPRCVYCPNPSYTDEARRAKINGSVVLQVVVTAEGRAENISVVRKLGYGLDESAVETARTWQFAPAKDAEGNPVATIVSIEMTFRIK